MVKNYIKLKKILQNAIFINCAVNEELKYYDTEDMKYFFMEDPDFYTHFGNYRTVTEKILKKIN